MGFTLHVPNKQARLDAEALLSQALDGMRYPPTPPAADPRDDDIPDNQLPKG